MSKLETKSFLIRRRRPTVENNVPQNVYVAVEDGNLRVEGLTDIWRVFLCDGDIDDSINKLRKPVSELKIKLLTCKCIIVEEENTDQWPVHIEKIDFLS